MPNFEAMKVAYPLVLLIVLSACVSRPSNDILIPEYNAALYLESLAQVEEKLSTQPSSIKLLEQKLYYCDKAGWPGTCRQALDEIQSVKGMDLKLSRDYLQYYGANDLSAEMVSFVGTWRSQFPLNVEQLQWFIQALVDEKEEVEARAELHFLLNEFDAITSDEFAANQYLRMGDTLRAVYHLSRVRKKDGSRHSMLPYGQMLFELGYAARGIEVLQSYFMQQPEDSHLSLTLATFYENYGYNTLARKVLMKVPAEDSIDYYLANLYQRDGLLDSAIFRLDSILVRDPEQLKALKIKGSLYEQKGWLSTALTTFEEAYNLDSTDTAIRNQIAVIQRKIAYLQRRKFEESKTPLLQLESKKIENR